MEGIRFIWKNTMLNANKSRWRDYDV
jgi:hypothetical protein